MPHIVQQRRAYVAERFPRGVPRLWCPLLTHFSRPGRIDAVRVRSHMRHVAPYAQGLLVPGSTGEGWELSDEDTYGLLAIVLEEARQTGQQVLVGVLRRSQDEMLQSIRGTFSWLQQSGWIAAADDPDIVGQLKQTPVAGITVCPPWGSSMTQEDLRRALSKVLALGVPTALYQLPQVTENEMTPETVQWFAERFANLFLFKDTSGDDRVALSGLVNSSVFLVRGAEGDYDRWTAVGGGPYDGLLLSSANVFSRQLYDVLDPTNGHDRESAIRLSRRIDRVVSGVFEMVGSLPQGNAFTNANKLLDHVMAYGCHVDSQLAPLLYSGQRLPPELVEQAARLVDAEQLMPELGYVMKDACPAR